MSSESYARATIRRRRRRFAKSTSFSERYGPLGSLTALAEPKQRPGAPIPDQTLGASVLNFRQGICGSGQHVADQLDPSLPTSSPAQSASIPAQCQPEQNRGNDGQKPRGVDRQAHFRNGPPGERRAPGDLNLADNGPERLRRQAAAPDGIATLDASRPDDKHENPGVCLVRRPRRSRRRKSHARRQRQAGC